MTCERRRSPLVALRLAGLFFLGKGLLWVALGALPALLMR